MKIIYILTNLNRSAPNTVIINIIKNLDNIDVSILSLNKSQDDNYKSILDELGIKYIEFKSFKESFSNILKINNKFNSYDILHLNGYHPNIYGFLLKKLNNKYRLISTCHSVEDQEAQSHNFKGLNYYKTKLRLLLQKKFYPSHDVVVAVSNQVKEYLNNFGCDNAITIYNGVEYDKFPKLIDKNLNNNCINLCQVGHVTRLKNQMYSLKLINYLKSKQIDAHIHFFGSFLNEKDYYQQLQNYVLDNNLEDEVTFFGSLQFDELFERLNSMDIYVMPSLSEGLPLALVEAMYFELPAIVSSNGGMKEIVKDYENGLVVDIDDDKVFDRIYEYIHTKKYLENGKRAREQALEKFDAKVMAERYEELYERVIK